MLSPRTQGLGAGVTGPPVVTMPTDFFTGGGVTGVGVAISEVLGCHKTLQLHPATHACAPSPEWHSEATQRRNT